MQALCLVSRKPEGLRGAKRSEILPTSCAPTLAIAAGPCRSVLFPDRMRRLSSYAVMARVQKTFDETVLHCLNLIREAVLRYREAPPWRPHPNPSEVYGHPDPAWIEELETTSFARAVREVRQIPERLGGLNERFKETHRLQTRAAQKWRSSRIELRALRVSAWTAPLLLVEVGRQFAVSRCAEALAPAGRLSGQHPERDLDSPEWSPFGELRREILEHLALTESPALSRLRRGRQPASKDRIDSDALLLSEWLDWKARSRGSMRQFSVTQGGFDACRRAIKRAQLRATGAAKKRSARRRRDD